MARAHELSPQEVNDIDNEINQAIDDAIRSEPSNTDRLYYNYSQLLIDADSTDMAAEIMSRIWCQSIEKDADLVYAMHGSFNNGFLSEFLKTINQNITNKLDDDGLYKIVDKFCEYHCPKMAINFINAYITHCSLSDDTNYPKATHFYKHNKERIFREEGEEKTVNESSGKNYRENLATEGRPVSVSSAAASALSEGEELGRDDSW